MDAPDEQGIHLRKYERGVITQMSGLWLAGRGWMLVAVTPRSVGHLAEAGVAARVFVPCQT